MIILSFFLLATLLFALTVWLYMKQPMFGRRPSGKRLDRIRRSPHYRDGAFQNKSHTPALTEGSNYGEVMRGFFFGDKSLLKPRMPVPSKKTNLRELDPAEDVLIWFGHSSYFLQLDGKRILVDPVMSGAASPVRFTTKAFAGTDIYSPNDLPEIDFLFISHDHWDHLDYRTVMALKPRIGKVITGLGTGEHLEHWGFDGSRIIEADWHERLELGNGFVVHTVPARHFSGRSFRRNAALWLSFALKTPNWNVFLGGDSGYDTHFAEAGSSHGPFDIAILENGQYDKHWKYIHMQPEDVIQAAKDLRADLLFPVHSGKFSLANHPWNEPLQRISTISTTQDIPLITPMIGEKVLLKDPNQSFVKWWQ